VIGVHRFPPALLTGEKADPEDLTPRLSLQAPQLMPTPQRQLFNLQWLARAFERSLFLLFT
jgi:hypothetical protein